MPSRPKYLTQADREEAKRQRQRKYARSPRGLLVSAANDAHRHTRKLPKPLGNTVQPPPALLLEHAVFEIPYDEPGFLLYFDDSFDIYSGPSDVMAWMSFPLRPVSETAEDSLDRHTVNYQLETWRLQVAIHALSLRAERTHERDLREELGRLEISLGLEVVAQRRCEEYAAALRHWRWQLQYLDQYDAAVRPREAAVFKLHWRWMARRAYRSYLLHYERPE
ncbi:hypothetical protein C8F01DRAFT_1353647 [Mycena amicta]|nr:hypothetical protein C8F01DRAFT_1353647 [Mycena amicta]